jgi:hypothetical protein
MKTEFLKRKEILNKENLNSIFNIIETEKENLSQEYNYIQLCNLIRDSKKQIDTYKLIVSELHDEMLRREMLF